jgi:hypothetical protein
MTNVRAWISHHERMLGIIVVASLVILLIVRFALLGETKPSGQTDLEAIYRSIVNGLISTIAVSAIVALSLRYVRPPEQAQESTLYVQPNDIDRYLRNAATTTREWTYFGHTGRYVRSAIFPLLLEQAKRGTAVRLVMLILDPNDGPLCEYYAQYRSTARTAKRGRPWTKETIQAELLATVLSAMELRASSVSIDVEIGFVKHVSLFRVDLASERALITQEDSQEPALGYESDSRFYEYYRRDSRMARDQAHLLKQLNSVTKFVLTNQPSCTATLASAGLDLTAFPKAVVDDAFSKAIAKNNPYA